MLDELKEEYIVNKVGGRFKLSTLIQKRLVALQRGSPGLVECIGKPSMDTVIQEILQDKIFLDASDNVIVAVAARPDVDDGPSFGDV
mgnify:CR=1 FL=1